MTDTNGNIVTEMMYKAWGEVRYSSGSSPTDFTYTGQRSEMDNIGLMFYNARWYDPELGRFAQADNIIPAKRQPISWDRFAYARNNPILFNDPSGHDVGCAGRDASECRGEYYNPDSSSGNKNSSMMGNNIGGGNSKMPTNNTVNDDSLLNLYLLGWSNVSTAYDISQNKNASLGEKIGANFYMGAWIDAHILFGIGAAGTGCVIAGPACVGAVEGALGIGTVLSADGNPTNEIISGVQIFRVWGEDLAKTGLPGSSAWGHSWTPIDPSTVTNFRNIAGIPSGLESGSFNAARFISVGTVNDPTGILIRNAGALDGQLGGLLEYIIPNPQAQILLQFVGGINPPY